MMLSDFGGFPAAAADAVHRITGLDQLRQAVGDCVARRRPLRARGFAHSMNGMSIPAPGETVIDMTGVRHLVWKPGGKVLAGAGLTVWEIDQYVREFGWKLPVVNDGSAEAPSVGGYISAGGFGAASVFYGGFWETVAAVTLVDGTGETRRLTRRDSAFPWLFGAMGALGVIYEAEIELVPAGSDKPSPVEGSPALPRGIPADWPDHMWLTLLVPAERRDEGHARLQRLVAAHPAAWTPRDHYEYYLPFGRFMPPLVLDIAGDGVAMGIWGDRAEGDAGLAAYMALEADFQAMIEAEGLRRYFQSELIRIRRPLESYVGHDCAARFAAVKAAFDPASLINSFMPMREAAPAD